MVNTRKSVGILTAITAGALLLSACGSPDVGEATLKADVAQKQVTLTQADQAPSVITATRQLGIDLVKDLSTDANNVVVSPSSLLIALSMLSDGANGQTLSQIEALLGATGQDRRDAVNALQTALRKYDGDPKIVQDKDLPEIPMVHLGDQVVVDDELDINAGFLTKLAETYGAGVLNTDLGTSDGKKLLDAWVNQNTGGLIKKSAIQPRPDLRLVLQDAIVLAAKWQIPFEDPDDFEFTLPDGTAIQTESMYQHDTFAYAQVNGWQAVRLPYTEGLYSDVILPPKGTDPVTATAEILDQLNTQLAKAPTEAITVRMPTLDIASQGDDQMDLVPVLKSLGMTDAFNDAADFSGISTTQALVVDQVAQQSVLQVDNFGTRAAAVTEIAVTATSAQLDPKELIVDRPYLFTISHADTDWTLFYAAIRDPRH